MKFFRIFKKKKLNSKLISKTQKPLCLKATDYLFALSDIGVERIENEDFAVAGLNAFNNKILFVCDGLGGYDGGKEAAEILGTTIVEKSYYFDFQKVDPQKIKQWFVDAVNEAKFQITKHIINNPINSRMASTLALCVITKNKIYGFNIGDSRIYGIKNDQIEQISKDHNFYNYLVDNNVNSNQISAYGNQVYAIVNYVGQFDEIELKYDFFEFLYQDYDWIITTSDGVHNFIDPDELKHQVLAPNNIDIIAENLIKKALENMSNDNLSVAIANLCV